jgi:hypothetical protein
MAAGTPKVNTAFDWRFKLVDSVDFATPETGLSPTVQVSKAGAAFAGLTGSPSVTEIGNGWYKVTVAAGDMNTTDVILRATATGAAQTDEAFYLDDQRVSDVYSRIGAPAGVSLAADVAAVKSDTAAIKAKTDNLPSDPADQSLIIAATNTILSDTNAILVDTAAMQPKVDELHDNRLTSTRAGYLDKLNITGNVASSAEVTAIQNNTRVVRSVPTVIDRPETGTKTVRIELLLYDAVGNMEVPDSAPTIELVNQAGTDLSARLDSATMALVETGRYRAVYTCDAAHAMEQLKWTFSVVEGGVTRKYGNDTQLVDTNAVDFTTADRAMLQTLHDVRIPGVVEPQTGDSYARLGNPAGATIAADIAAVQVAANSDVLIRTTIATLTSQNDFTLAAGSADDNAYFGHDVIITDSVTAEQKAVHFCSTYTGATKRITTVPVTASFTLAVGDVVVVKASTALRPTVHTRTLDVSSGGNAGVDWANVASPTTTVNLSGTTVGTVTNLASTAVAAIWNALTSGMSTAGSIGKKLADWVAGQVSDLTQAALAKFANTDTGETAAVAGSVAQLSQGSGGGGGGTIVMGPLVAVREPGNRIMSPMKLEMWKAQNKQFDIAVVDADGAAVSLVGKTLRFVVGDTQAQPVGVFDVEAASITIATNVATVPVTGAQAAVASTERQWWLWSLNDPSVGQNTVLAWGPFEIRPAVLDVA